MVASSKREIGFLACSWLSVRHYAYRPALCYWSRGKEHGGIMKNYMIERAGGKRRAASYVPIFCEIKEHRRIGRRQGRNVWPSFASDAERIMQTHLSIRGIYQDTNNRRHSTSQQRAINAYRGFLGMSLSPGSLYEALTTDTTSIYNKLEQQIPPTLAQEVK